MAGDKYKCKICGNDQTFDSLHDARLHVYSIHGRALVTAENYLERVQ